MVIRTITGSSGRFPSDVQIYLGKATQRILNEAQFFSPLGANIQAAGQSVIASRSSAAR